MYRTKELRVFENRVLGERFGRQKEEETDC
jgi:hypothetical protein